ncbi:CoA-binding protein [Thiothrix eikelboomii]|uniref:CoA-binding protein n=1 Tax=Thiothrix eikelboomii TaxID=92487 RepID=UPI003BB0F711
MGHHYLNQLFAPSAVAIFGATERPDTVGFLVLQNLIEAGFQGKIFPINPKYKTIQGLTGYPGLPVITEAIELAIIATPANTVGEIIKQCGEHGIRATAYKFALKQCS